MQKADRNQWLTVETAHMCAYAYHCALLQYTVQHITVLIILRLISQTIIVAQTLPTIR